MRCSLGRASACCGMLCGMKIQATKCWSHQTFAVWHMMSKRFQNYISQLEKKIRQSSLISFHSFCNLCKKLFFNTDAIKQAAYAEQHLPHSKAAMYCILPCGIVWMHFKISIGKMTNKLLQCTHVIPLPQCSVQSPLLRTILEIFLQFF